MPLILIADDDRITTHLTGALLRRAGYLVETTGDVASTVSRLRGAPRPDCLLLDMHLPDGTAADVMRQSEGAGDDVPIILLTGATPEQLAPYRAEPRIRAFVSKPIAPEVLIGAVTQIAGAAS